MTDCLPDTNTRRTGRHHLAHLCAMLGFFASPPAFAHGPALWVEAQAQHMTKQKVGTEVLAWVDGNLAGPVGYFLFLDAASDGYRQAYGGPTMRPFSWLEFGAGIGRERGAGGSRRAAYFSADGAMGSFAGYFEDGPWGPAHRVFLNYWLTAAWGLGWLDEDAGRGPRAAYRLSAKTSVWGAVLRDQGNNATNSVVAVSYQF